MSSLLKEQILERLTTVREPCSLAMLAPTNIVQMGLVENIDIEAGEATITLCLTDPACVHFNGMQRYIADALAGIPQIERVKVIQTTDVLWTPERVLDRSN